MKVLRTTSLEFNFTVSYKKECKFPNSCSYIHPSASCGDFFVWVILSFCQITKLFAEIVTIEYSLLE